MAASDPGDASPAPIRRNEKIAEAVARDIVRRIAAGKLPPGAQLPSEAQMAVDYGVGRASLREALRILEIHGLISIKPGPGEVRWSPERTPRTSAEWRRCTSTRWAA